MDRVNFETGKYTMEELEDLGILQRVRDEDYVDVVSYKSSFDRQSAYSKYLKSHEDILKYKMEKAALKKLIGVNTSCFATLLTLHDSVVHKSKATARVISALDLVDDLSTNVEIVIDKLVEHFGDNAFIYLCLMFLKGSRTPSDTRLTLKSFTGNKAQDIKVSEILMGAEYLIPRVYREDYSRAVNKVLDTLDVSKASSNGVINRCLYSLWDDSYDNFNRIASMVAYSANKITSLVLNVSYAHPVTAYMNFKHLYSNGITGDTVDKLNHDAAKYIIELVANFDMLWESNFSNVTPIDYTYLKPWIPVGYECKDGYVTMGSLDLDLSNGLPFSDLDSLVKSMSLKSGNSTFVKVVEFDEMKPNRFRELNRLAEERLVYNSSCNEVELIPEEEPIIESVRLDEKKLVCNSSCEEVELIPEVEPVRESVASRVRRYKLKLIRELTVGMDEDELISKLVENLSMEELITLLDS